jgi:hypothetical protein
VNNPFIQKAEAQQEQLRKVIADHVKGMEYVCSAFSDKPDDDPIKIRMAARLEETRQIARDIG